MSSTAMQPSHLLSDLSSLSEPLCDHAAAMKLVSVHKATNKEIATDAPPNTNEVMVSAPSTGDMQKQDVDLKRADDLVSLHHDVKVKYSEDGGLDDDVLAARQRVSRVLASLGQPT